MANVLELDCASATPVAERDLGTNYSEVWLEVNIAFNAAYLAALTGGTSSVDLIQLSNTLASNFQETSVTASGGIAEWTAFESQPASPYAPTVPVTDMQFYHVKMHEIAGSPRTSEMWIDGVALTLVDSGHDLSEIRLLDLEAIGVYSAGALVWYSNLVIGTTDGGSDIYTDDFSGDLSGWNNGTARASIVADPGITPAAGASATGGRVFIAFNDGPLEPHPSWTRIDGGDAPFPQNFVSGYDVESGRQTLISQTDTGTATVYINDHETGLFDPRNVSSPYFGNLDGRQILLRLYDPVADAWEDQFRGLIDDITWELDPATGEDGKPINASIQIECVDMFDYLAGYGLTPGLDGVTPRSVPSGGTAGGAPPAGYEDGVYYAATAGSVDDRFIQVLTDVGIDSSRYTVASGNVHVKAVKYDPDESALQALRDAADAELPFIANIYCDRHGNFQFRGRYSRFNPDDVAAEPGSTWDFTRWAVGDGTAILADPTRAQMRLLSFSRNRSDLINVAIAYPQGMAASNMPSQVWADTTSITAYGKHSAPPMSDLLTDTSDVGGVSDVDETAKYAELLVKNQKDPRENVSALQVKAVRPDDSRAETTWALLTKADISHIINVAVGYPSGTGLSGATPDDDYYIEGRHLRVRPLNPSHDYVECDYDLSPAVWSMDTHGVFPAFTTPTTPSGLSADFAYA